ncbi:MAG: molecular chaperone DnaK [Rhodoferax sp.]|uniref:TraR/DksA family transcriptional regulator n=1 Tax=Rhodoferax sp. TaxID=50421 RepID=UPI00268D1243|nr:molecular chaperone DnaK [Rhodoferax sp.]MDP2677466.1 molecular chaperone DnaK [Rhodoferax sp.]
MLIAIDLEPLRERLQVELSKTIEAIQQARQSAAPVELDQSSMGRVSRNAALQQQALAQGVLDRLALRQRKLTAALDRCEAGSYGLCCACRGGMEPERLNADPAAVFCQECVTERQ